MTSTARSSEWLIDVNDLPIGFIDVALSMPPAELAGDTTAVLLRPEQGPPAAVLKVARGPLEFREIAHAAARARRTRHPPRTRSKNGANCCHGSWHSTSAPMPPCPWSPIGRE